MAWTDLTEKEVADLPPLSKEPTSTGNWQDIVALNNTVFDQDNNRTLSLPQTLTAEETTFIIKRDIESKKNFFGQEDVGGFDAYGMGLMSIIPTMNIAAGGELKAQGELMQIEGPAISPEARKTQDQVRSGIDAFAHFFGMEGASDKIQKMLDATIFNDKAMVEKGGAIVERNKKYMADGGITGEGLTGTNKLIYDLTQGVGSMATSLGLAALTRTPASAGMFFGAIQHSSIYQEARQAGKTPEVANEIAIPAGILEGALEFVGLDHLIKALKGNSAIKRFINGFGIEFTQESTQGAAEEIVTQSSGMRKDKAGRDDTGDFISGYSRRHHRWRHGRDGRGLHAR